MIEANVPYEPEVFNPNTLVFKFPAIQGPSRPADQVSLWEQAQLLVLIQREWADNAVSNTLYFKPKWRLVEHIQDYKSVAKKIRDYKLHLNEEQKLLVKAWHEDGQYSIKRIEETRSKKKLVLYREKWPMPGQDKVQLKIYQYDENHEEDIIENVLASIAPVIKSCSLLPHSAKGVYRQMPQEGLTKEEYQKLVSQIKPINWSKFCGSDGDAEADKYCSGGICTTGV